MFCRVCGSSSIDRIFHSPPPSVISISKVIKLPVNVYVCENCGHGQSEDIDFKNFYDHEYRFQLASRDHDELHAVVEGEKIYRTDLQAKIALELLDAPVGAGVLDYGAAKARTLRKVCESRTDLVPRVFDVSDAYADVWDEWIPKARQAQYKILPNWKGNLDVVFSFFVLEHVAEPNAIVNEISNLLRPDGSCIIAVPDPLMNYSDLVVVEHVSHFTRSSLSALLNRNGLEIDFYSSQRFFGAHVVRARKSTFQACPNQARPAQTEQAQSDVAGLRAIGEFWAQAQSRLRIAAQKHPGPCAIYGAGVYGCYVATRIEDHSKIRCFVDRNPFLWGDSAFGIPIVGPDQLPEDVFTIYAGVNPLKARYILGDIPEWRGRNLETIYLSEP